MIRRDLAPHLLALATRHPIITVTGPRQSGKTTLCRDTFPHLPYVSLERPDRRAEVAEDPLGFLADHPDGAIIDEVQRVPELLSYLQVEVDERPQPGRFVLTGSQHFGLLRGVSQSLAGRTALVHLLPPSLAELRRFEDAPDALWDLVYRGAYPAIYDRRVPASEWLGSYVGTYVERDVRDVLAIQDLRTFQTFLTLAAGTTGGLLNLSRLAADVGVAVTTIKAWVGVLETSFLAVRVAPWHKKLRSRLAKAPKLHFLDSGLACWLLGIRSPEQLASHPLRGAIFESWVAAELLKCRWHAGVREDLFHYRDRRGLEVDLVLEQPDRILAVEVKSGRTVAGDQLRALHQLGPLVEKAGLQMRGVLVYGGDEARRTRGVELVPWSQLDRLTERSADPTAGAHARLQPGA